MKTKLKLIVLLYLACINWCFGQTSQGELSINLTFSEEVIASVKTEGRLFIFMTQNQSAEPRTLTAPFPWAKAQIFAMNFTDLKPKKALELDMSMPWSKTSDWSLGNIPAGKYFIQVLWDQDTHSAGVNTLGNLYSKKIELDINGATSASVSIDKTITGPTIIESEHVRLVDFKSDTLSKWWGWPFSMKASILLPSNYDTKKEYPISYNIAGYGGRYDRINSVLKDEDFMNWWESDDSPQVIYVFLDGDSPYGDSYHMNSENNGPHGYALIHELIPHIESKFRGTNSAKTRFVDGCSTGGWVSLGLQLYYPDQFNGVFSFSPDAVEFENYQLVNIYKDKNAYINEFGYQRPVARTTDGEPMISMQAFIQYENVLGAANSYLNSGGQFSAHTALYSPKGADGLPMPLFDPVTGVIDSDVAAYWKKFDFKIHAKENWATLGPKLAGKVYVWMGDMDHFYLNKATRTFAEYLESTTSPKSDAIIEFEPMEGHCSEFSYKLVLEKIQGRLDVIAGADAK